MKDFYEFLVRCLPLTIGMAMVLIGMCFLVDFYDNRLDFEEEFFAFVFWFAVGMPLMLFGIDKLSKSPE